MISNAKKVQTLGQKYDIIKGKKVQLSINQSKVINTFPPLYKSFKLTSDLPSATATWWCSSIKHSCREKQNKYIQCTNTQNIFKNEGQWSLATGLLQKQRHFQHHSVPSPLGGNKVSLKVSKAHSNILDGAWFSYACSHAHTQINLLCLDPHRSTWESNPLWNGSWVTLILSSLFCRGRVTTLKWTEL